MKRMASWILTCALLLTLLPAGAWAAEGYAFSGGSGTAEDPYLIATVEDLQNIGDQDNVHFLQIDDIDLSESDWWDKNTISIGASGSYNGGGYRILNYHSTRGGLFYRNKGVIQNVSMENVNVYVTTNIGNIGALADLCSGGGSVENCSVQGSVKVDFDGAVGVYSGIMHVGGIVGVSYSDSTITNCTLEEGSTVSAVNRLNKYSLDLDSLYAGGIVGQLTDGTVQDCRNLGESVFVSSYDQLQNPCAGGIVGYMTGTVAGCVNQADISGMSDASKSDPYRDDNVGGIAGATKMHYNTALNVIRDCRNEGSVSGYSAAGMVADSSHIQISDCVNTGTCHAGSDGGGITGLTDNCIVERCRNEGEIVSDGYGGGIVGCVRYDTSSSFQTWKSEIISCYNVGAVSAAKSLGGILGNTLQDPSIVNCFNRGAITRGDTKDGDYCYAGGLAGELGRGSIENSYSAGHVLLPNADFRTYGGWLIGEARFVPNLSICLWQTYDEADTPEKAIGGTSTGGTVVGCEGLSGEQFTDGTALAKLNVEPGEWYADLENVNDGYPVLDWLCRDACVQADKEPGLYTESFAVSLTAPDAQQIFYRLDETGDWTEYSGPIQISQSCMVQAYAQYEAGNSPVTSFAYRIASYPVSVGKEPGTYTETIVVPLLSSAGETYYTIDGSDPTTSETATQSSMVVVTHSVTIRAAAKVNGVWGDVQSFEYVISPAMTAEPAGGQLDGPTDVTLSLEDGASGFSIYYTLNGTDPRENGRLYTDSAKVPVSSSCTLKAAACKEGGWGAVYTFQYEVAEPELVTTHPSGNYQSAFYLDLSCPMAGVEIYTDFSGSFQKYGSEQDIPIYQSSEFQVQLRYRGQVIKTEALHYTLPEISVTPDKDPGNKSERLEVSLTCTLGGLELRYTLDGSTPTAQSPLYQDQPIPINRTSTLKVAAFMPEREQSVWVSSGFTYTLMLPEVTASPGPGIYATPFEVTLSMTGNDDGTFQIYYTTDGSDPTTSATAKQDNTVTVDRGLTIRAVPISRIGDYVRYGIEGTFTYQAQTYSLTVQQAANGTVSGTPAGSYVAGTSITLTAQADEGYYFGGWQVSGITPGDLSSPELSFTMPARAVSVTPVFRREIPEAGTNGMFQGEISQPDENAIFISTPEQLAAIGTNSSYPLSGSYVLTTDLDLSDYGNWTPIGGNTPFSGTFDGQGHVISHLTYQGEGSYAGLFGRINERGQVKNLGLEDVSISVTGGSDDYYVGGIVGQFENTYTTTSRAELCNCYVTGEITVDLGYNSSLWLGGLAGELAADASDCFNLATLTGKIGSTYGKKLYLGGIAGGIRQSAASNDYVIERCFNSGELFPSYFASSLFVGGITGYLNTNVTMKQCYNTADIWLEPRSSCGRSAYLGGIAGVSFSAPADCYNLGDIGSDLSDSGPYYEMACGGIVGQFTIGDGRRCTIEHCYNAGTVVARAYGTAYAGGIIGAAERNGYLLYLDRCVVLSPEISAHMDFMQGSTGSTGSFKATVLGTDVSTGSSYVNYYLQGITTHGEGSLSTTGANYITSEQAHSQTWYETTAQWDFSQVWAMDQGQNDGMPYFQWQTGGLRILGYSGNTAQVYSGGYVENITLLAASYDESGRMLGSACVEGDLNSGVNQVYLPLTQKGTQVKVFLLEAGTRKPLAPSVTIAQ